MPRMDGFELIRRIRADRSLCGHADHRSERRYRPRHSAADRGHWASKRFSPSPFPRRGAAETGATSRCQDRIKFRLAWRCASAPADLGAQTQAAPDLAKILERLDRLEQENRALAEQVGLRPVAGRERRAPPAPPRLRPWTPPASTSRIQRQRIEEQAQTKVESSQKFPIRLAGMALFNAFMNSRQTAARTIPQWPRPPAPGTAGPPCGRPSSAWSSTVRSTIWGGKVHGSVYMDSLPGATPLRHALAHRLHRDRLERPQHDGRVEKPIFNPREPSSLAQVGDLAAHRRRQSVAVGAAGALGTGFLRFGSATGLRAQVGAVRNPRDRPYVGTVDAGSRRRRAGPGRPLRLLITTWTTTAAWRSPPDSTPARRTPGGFSIPSNLFSLDWFFNPWKRVEFSGAFYSGQNVADLGTGAINQGYVHLHGPSRKPMPSRGGWGQITLHAARRGWISISSPASRRCQPRIGHGRYRQELLFGGNLISAWRRMSSWRRKLRSCGPCILGRDVRINNHYDLALAYLF